MTHFNELTPAEAERLALLAEECGEVIQQIGKTLRHGYASSHPDFPADKGGPTNRYNLMREVGDVLVAIEMMVDARDFDQVDIDDRMRVKRHKVQDYLHHQYEYRTR